MTPQRSGFLLFARGGMGLLIFSSAVFAQRFPDTESPIPPAPLDVGNPWLPPIKDPKGYYPENSPPTKPPRDKYGAIFFPPIPPPLDTAIDRTVAGNTRASNPGSLAAPASEMVGYVNEFFYPQLSTQLFDRSVSYDLSALLRDYVFRKQTLLKELRETLAATETTEAVARREKLAELARQQAPAFVELETIGERLRAGLIASGRDWSEFRKWKLSAGDRRGFSPGEIAQVMRAAVYYEKGLLPAQRRLLREIVVDLAVAVPATSDTSGNQRGPIFFSPLPARITLPDSLPPAVTAQLAEYQTRRALLKTQLYDAVYDADGKRRFFGSPFPALAEKQAAPLRELEALAEEIRIGLEPIADIIQPSPRSPLPKKLTMWMEEIDARRSALRLQATEELQGLVEWCRATAIPVAINFQFEADGVRVRLSSIRGAVITPGRAERIEDVRDRLNAVAERYNEGIGALLNIRDDMRRDVGAALGVTEPAAIDRAIVLAMRSILVKNDETAYRDYRIAVLQPGLSIEQRCLLFDAAIEALKLPLPAGERQPIDRRKTW